MILDTGIIDIYRVNADRGSQSPVSGLEPIYHNWYGMLRHDAAKGQETGDNTIRVRIHGVDVKPYDIARAQGEYWRVTRVFEGYDDDTGLPMCDLTLENSDRHFVRVDAIPRTVADSGVAAFASVPDMERAREIWASIGNITGDDYYAAETAGHNLSVRVTVYNLDYNAEPYIMYNGRLYESVRAEVHGPVTELFCEVSEAWHE